MFFYLKGCGPYIILLILQYSYIFPILSFSTFFPIHVYLQFSYIFILILLLNKPLDPSWIYTQKALKFFLSDPPFQVYILSFAISSSVSIVSSENFFIKTKREKVITTWLIKCRSWSSLLVNRLLLSNSIHMDLLMHRSLEASSCWSSFSDNFKIVPTVIVKWGALCMCEIDLVVCWKHSKYVFSGSSCLK